MSKDKNILNLDELLGTKTLKVRYQSKEYPIRVVSSLSPEEFGRVMAYGAKFSMLTEEQAELNDGEIVMKAVSDVMEIVAPEMPKTLSLQESMAVLKFWTESNRLKNAPRAVITKRKRR
jgi:hypothetical protein